jgi:Trypsin
LDFLKDTSNRNEPLPFLEFNISEIITHPEYNPANLHNDIAIMRTLTPVPLGVLPNIGTACLPSAKQKKVLMPLMTILFF